MPFSYYQNQSLLNLDIEEVARVDGVNEWRIFLFISIPLASKALISGSILSFARALGEFGATLMFTGNIPGETQTIPTAILLLEILILRTDTYVEILQQLKQ